MSVMISMEVPDGIRSEMLKAIGETQTDEALAMISPDMIQQYCAGLFIAALSLHSVALANEMEVLCERNIPADLSSAADKEPMPVKIQDNDLSGHAAIHIRASGRRGR